MRTKYVNVKDEGRSLHFLVAEFDEGDKWLIKTGWEKDVLLIVQIDIQASACISHFNHPPYDLRERSRQMIVTGTHLAFAQYLKTIRFNEIPKTVDVSEIRESLK